MAKGNGKPVNNLSKWTPRDLITLRAAARRKERVADVARRLGRTSDAVQQKAMREGFSFR